MKPLLSAPILIVGDIMLDRYWMGGTHRVSPEAPIPVVHVQTEEARVGGAGNVACNLASLGLKPILLGFTGRDEAGHQLTELLQQSGVQAHLLRSDTLPTIVKLRVLSQQQQMIRVDFEKSFDGIDKNPLEKAYIDLLDGDTPPKVVILSDYQKGTLTHPQRLIQAARDRGIPVFVDPKGLNFEKYRGATLIKPNLKEFEAIVGHCESEHVLIQKGQALLASLDISHLLLTRGAQGMLLIQRDHPPYQIAATSPQLIDVTGAGDTVIATLAAAIASGYAEEPAVYLANLAAGIAVSKLGTATVTQSELMIAYHQHHSAVRGILDDASAEIHIAHARQKGQTVVMTNGCFDLLHMGHIAYLRKAKALGDILIVAINDDASIQRLKGPERPVSPLYSRMNVLAALEMVDYVVPFSEDTPLRLIQLISPDILVKGPDYEIHQIVGAEHVLSYGGRVERISHEHQDISTSSLIRKSQAG